ncbi:MAG: alpha/beta hydrolase [Moraxellaceae bacterium]|nr:MAG: alpha/beta hydrolase [Moraxellaceae bacterium]
MDFKTEKRYTTAENQTIVADVWGQSTNKSVIFAHGGGQTRHAWKNTASIFADAGWQSITVDLRGHGDSDWAADGDYSMEKFAEDLIYVASQCEQPPAIVGASLGGLSALVAQRLSDNKAFSAVVLVDIVPNMKPNGAQKILAFMGDNLEEGFATLEEASESIAAYLPHRPKPKSLDGLRKNLRLGEDGRYRWHWDPKFILGKTSDRPSSDVEHRRKMVDSAKNLTVPTLLVRGQMSELVSEQQAEEFLEMVPHAKYVNVEKAHHMVAGDKNDIFTSAVVEFLSNL